MKLVLFIVAVVLAFAYFLDYQDRKVLESVTQGNKNLECYIGHQFKDIPKEKILDFSNGVWYFTNGSAKNCEVK